MAKLSPDKVYDVAVIGGGINGAAVARDCAMRRLSVALFEKDDLASGGTGAYPGLDHGLPGYLRSERENARRQAEDNDTIGRIAPNLVFRTPVLIPLLRDDPSSHRDQIDGFRKSYTKYMESRRKPGPVTLTSSEVTTLDPGLSKEIVSAVAVEEWGVDSARLTVLTAKSAQMAGADIFTGAKVGLLVVQDGKVVGFQVSQPDSGTSMVRARMVINLTGPWTTFLAPERTLSLSLQVQPMKGVSVIFDRRIVNVSVACRVPDTDDTLFLVPRDHFTIAGVLSREHYESPDRVVASARECATIFSAVQKYFPRINDYRAISTTVSVRAANPETAVNETNRKDYQIFDHADEGADGLLTMFGGRLVSHRLMAEELTDLICRKMKRRETCRTHLESLPGCTPEMPWREEAKRLAIDPLTVKRLMQRHGYNALEILEGAKKHPELAQTLCECEQVIAAEVEYCAREEWGTNLEAICRRTRLGAGPCQGSRCAAATALFLGQSQRWTAEQAAAEATKFVDKRFATNLPILYGEQAKQQEYARALAVTEGTA